jgi:hypothetical protein
MDSSPLAFIWVAYCGVGFMPSRVSSSHHYFRDLPPAFVLVGCAIVGVSFLIALSPYWSLLPHESITRPHLNGREPQLKEFNFDKRYAGKIITGSVYDDKCRELVFDNRNGNMWDNGYVNCDGVSLQLLQEDHQKNMDIIRLREVGKAFRHEDN